MYYYSGNYITSKRFFEEFIDEVVKSGIKIVYVHARNAILNGFSPKDNRNIPPLDYDFVKKIKKIYPNIIFVLNGGIESLQQAVDLSSEFNNVMVGRLVQKNPFCLSEVYRLFASNNKAMKILKWSPKYSGQKGFKKGLAKTLY